MNDRGRWDDLLRKSLEVMEDIPADIEETVAFLARKQEIDFPDPLSWLRQQIDSADVNSSLLHSFGLALRKWDRIETGKWIGSSSSFSDERRSLCYRKLGLPANMDAQLNDRFPVFRESDRPIVVAEKHEEWYADRKLRDDFYWKAYSRFLLEKKGWDEDDIGKLDGSTEIVLRKLSDPCRNEVFSSRGLVVGYVQSGKTANFTGVLAKAVDAGYRFIIVLAGTIDILRSQTQRRLDKELVGKELLKTDYSGDDDWPDFLSHGGTKPSQQGFFDIECLTGITEDYRELKHAISALEFKSVIPGKIYNDPDNLRRSPVRIVVIKKIPAVMKKLAADLERIRGQLADVPTLIVDDESDQASINTLDPKKTRGVKDKTKKRTATNFRIVDLLESLPRAQYVGYTATPFANVFVDPNDDEDIFPKDFIISLPRPDDYMGVSDFYDFGDRPAGFDSNEQAFIRNVVGEDCGRDLGRDLVRGVENPNHLLRAIDSFVLAGAIKLFRERTSGGRWKFKHHTMLVHHSVRTNDHELNRQKVSDTFENAGYYGGAGVARLQVLFKDDFQPVNASKGNGLPMPDSWVELAPYIGECLGRLNAGKTVRVINGDNKDDTPDFDRDSVWAILVGGTKLSRGYTVEGLTITFFRRVSTTSDTLMQMGRWFGYRPGYRDLVRLFIGRDEPYGAKGKDRLDLYEAFRAMCLDEEKFREEIKRYQSEITPKQIPPLVPSHLTKLRPVAKNKMYNAEILFKNFSEQTSEPTLAPNDAKVALKNQHLAVTLLRAASLVKRQFKGQRVKDGKNISGGEFEAFVGGVTTETIVDFLLNYQWTEEKKLVQHEIEFLCGKEGDTCIDDWLVIAPVINGKFGVWPEQLADDVPDISVHERSRTPPSGRFGVYSTPAHRDLAEYIAGIGDAYRPSDGDAAIALHNPRRAVMLFYPVRDENDTFVTPGFVLIFPKNGIKRKIVYTVRDKTKPDAIVIPTQD